MMQTKFILTGILVAGVAANVLTGCGKKQAPQGAQAPLVRSMQVIVRDNPELYEYSGFVEANREMNLVAQVGGQVLEKYFRGGDFVQQGQALYKIDQRNYEANYLSAKAAYLTAEADAMRYEKLYAKDAVSRQMLDNMRMQRDVAKAKFMNAQKDIDETVVKAPFAGRTDTAAVEVGNVVSANNTVLTKLSDTSPVYVKFSISEPEYMRLAAESKDGAQSLVDLTLTLANGEKYALPGRIAEVNRGIGDGTGSLTVRAQFDNPDMKLLPGMFAHVQATGLVQKDAVLIPQRAIVELLYKKLVFVLGEDNKVTMKEVKLGQNVGRLVQVTEGLQQGDVIVVEGTGKIRNGMQVTPQPMQEQELATDQNR